MYHFMLSYYNLGLWCTVWVAFDTGTVRIGWFAPFITLVSTYTMNVRIRLFNTSGKYWVFHSVRLRFLITCFLHLNQFSRGRVSDVSVLPVNMWTLLLSSTSTLPVFLAIQVFRFSLCCKRLLFRCNGSLQIFSRSF